MNKYEQFQEAMRTIQARRTAANALAEARTREVNERFPQIREINSRLSDTAMELFHVLQAGGDTQEQIEQIRRRNLEGQRIVRQMLLANGLPEDYLELHYTCPKCDDTGYANGCYCDCLKRELGRLAIEEMNRHAQVKLCSFDSFLWSITGTIRHATRPCDGSLPSASGMQPSLIPMPPVCCCPATRGLARPICPLPLPAR